jgi:adenylate cyclase
MQARFTQHTLIAAFVLALFVLCLPILWPTSERLDFLWLDRLTAQQAQRDTADPDIVLVDIDDYSLRAMSDTVGRWPWPRATHAELVEWLLAQGARAVVFDIWFSEPDIQRPEFDQYFGEVLDQHSNIFLSSLLMNSAEPERTRRFDSYPTNLPLQRTGTAVPDARGDLLLPAMGSPGHWQLGLINYLADTDGIARH